MNAPDQKKTNYVLRILPIVLLAAVLLLPAVAAQDVSMSVLPVDDRILRDETAEYLITFTNNGGAERKVRLQFGGDIEWMYQTAPLHHGFTGVPLPPYSSVQTKVYVSLRDQSFQARQYRLALRAKEETTGQVMQDVLVLNLRSFESGDYTPAVSIGVDFRAEVDPREPAQVRILLRNRNALNIPEVLIESKSTLAQKVTTTSLGPLEEKVVIQDLDFNPYDPPQEDLLLVRLTSGEKLLGSAEVNYRTIGHSIVNEKETRTPGFLREHIRRTFTNDGNVPAIHETMEKTTLWRMLFTDISPDTKTAITSEGRQYAWQLALPPQQSVDVTINRDYRWGVYGLFILIVGLILYYTVRSPMLLAKEASILGGKGDVSESKIVLHIKNRSTARLEDVHVTDSVPGIMQVDRNFGLGTLKPDKIMSHPKRGTILRWQIPYLEPLEERIITYRVSARLKIIGDVSLPAFVAKYHLKKKERVTTSNQFLLESVRGPDR